MSNLSEEAVRVYDDLLCGESNLMKRTQEELFERLEEVRFVFAGRMLSPYLRPHFISRADWDRISGICNTFWSSVLKVGDLTIDNVDLQDYLGLTEAEKRLISTDPKFRGVSRFSRLDSFLTKDSYQFVELNAETPAGSAYADVAAEIFQGLEVMKRFTKQYKLSHPTMRQMILEVLLNAYKEFSGNGKKPQIAIVDFKGLATQREFELVEEFFERSGYKTVISDPRELEFKNGKLHKGDFEIDIIYKRLLVNELLEKIDECGELIKGYNAQSVCVVNSFRGKLVHKKLLFGVLTDEKFADFFTPEEREVVRLHVPWTRRMEARKTQFHGKDIDLIDFVKDNREQLVLKPNDDYGGKGIFIGWQATAVEWDNAMQTALTGDYLVQERVVTSREIFPYVNKDGSVSWLEHLVDLDPMLFDGKVGGAFTRLSTSELANVTSGGGMVPVFIVEGRN